MHSALHSYQASASHIFLLKFYHYFTFFFPGPLIHSISFSFLTASFYFLFSIPFSLCFFISPLLFLFVTSYSFPTFFPPPCFLLFLILISSHVCNFDFFLSFNPYPTAFPYGNGMVLHFYQQQESSTTKTVHKVINKGLKTYV